MAPPIRAESSDVGKASIYAIMTMGIVYLLGLVVIAFAPDTGGRMKEEGAGA